jgi:ribonuclease P/MRP protein subunit RPP40
MISFLESVTEAKAYKKPVDVVYLDFSKAFDKVPYKRLLEKPRVKGVSKEVAKWIEHWLTERTQRVSVGVGGEMSEEGEMGSGVPQGTVFGSLASSQFL